MTSESDTELPMDDLMKIHRRNITGFLHIAIDDGDDADSASDQDDYPGGILETRNETKSQYSDTPITEEHKSFASQYAEKRRILMKAWDILNSHPNSRYFRRIVNEEEDFACMDHVYQITDLLSFRREINTRNIESASDFMMACQLMFTNIIVFNCTNAIFTVLAKEMHNETFLDCYHFLHHAIALHSSSQKRTRRKYRKANRRKRLQNQEQPVAFNWLKRRSYVRDPSPFTRVSRDQRIKQTITSSARELPKKIMMDAWNVLNGHRHSSIFRKSRKAAINFVKLSEIDLPTLETEIETGTIYEPKDLLLRIQLMFTGFLMNNVFSYPVNLYVKQMYLETFATCHRLLNFNVEEQYVPHHLTQRRPREASGERNFPTPPNSPEVTKPMIKRRLSTFSEEDAIVSGRRFY